MEVPGFCSHETCCAGQGKTLCSVCINTCMYTSTRTHTHTHTQLLFALHCVHKGGKEMGYFLLLFLNANPHLPDGFRPTLERRRRSQRSAPSCSRLNHGRSVHPSFMCGLSVTYD
ncbi:unnamed protein product [Arctogadus glacialis]